MAPRFDIWLSSSVAGVLSSPPIMAEKNNIQEKEEQIRPELREFIDRVIVPALVQKYLEEFRQHPVSASPNENPDSTPDAGNR
jgi:hypothetical protein